jgi:methionine-gamma-lyase
MERRPPLGPMAPELTRSTTFAMENAEHMRAVGADEIAGEFYPRYGHPAGRRFESCIATLEGADGAVSFASGMAALHAVFTTFLGAGDRFACSRDVYGGVTALARKDLPRFGIEVVRFDPFDLSDVERAARGSKLVHFESPVNPICRVVDIESVVRAAHAAGALVSHDATFVPPPFQRPHSFDVDLVVHSVTKLLGGHSDVLAGVVSGRHELMEKLEAFRRRSGAVLGPDTAWLALRSLATLELRARAAADNAHKLAHFLAGRVQKVHYPGLAEHPDHALARRQMDGFGAMLAFEVAGGLDAAVAVFDRFRVIARAVSLGGVESLASLPLHTSHAMMSPEERRAAGIDDGLIRLSVGVEPYDRLEQDLRQALE